MFSVPFRLISAPFRTQLTYHIRFLMFRSIPFRSISGALLFVGDCPRVLGTYEMKV